MLRLLSLKPNTRRVDGLQITERPDLRVSARGFGVKDGQYCMSESGIRPVRVNPNDILTVYPLAVAGGTASNALAWVETTKGTELMQALGCGCR